MVGRGENPGIQERERRTQASRWDMGHTGHTGVNWWYWVILVILGYPGTRVRLALGWNRGWFYWNGGRVSGWDNEATIYWVIPVPSCSWLWGVQDPGVTGDEE